MDIVTLALAKKYADEKLTNIDGSSSTQSDWNQNDETALDYIKNRPFYSTGEYESKELLKDFKPTALGGGSFILMTCPVFIEGQTYQVILNNEEFICVGHIDNEGSVSLGNINYETDGWTDEHEPFSLSSLGGMGILNVNPATTSTEYIISINEATEKIQLLDKKYIKDYLVGEKTEGKELVYEDKTYTGGVGSEIFNSPANKAIGSYSHAEGADTVALGDNSHAEGFFTKALVDDSHAEGSGTYAEGNSSHAEGYYTQTFGIGSHSEGIHTIASGNYSHAEGENTIANSQSSHVQGRFNVLDSLPKYTYSYFISNIQHNGEENVYILNNTPILNAEVGTFDAEITETQVKNLKTNDLVIFSNQKPFDTYYNITEIQSDDNSQYQLALTGITTQINRGLGTYAHIVGNGTSSDQRSNAHTLDWSGNAWYQGDVYVGSNSGVNKDEGSKKLATEDFVNEQIVNVSSVQSDWNQNDESELDYIKNRPFYAGDPELTEVFNGNISFNNHTSFINHFSLLEGETYQVIWNNQEYFCICQKNTIGANQFLCIGNTSLAKTDSTQWIDGEPFLIQDGQFATIVNTSDDSSSCSAIVNIYKEYVKLLDRKFVSYMAGENVEGKIVTYNDQTYTCPTGAEIFNSPTNKAIGLYSHAEGHGSVAYGAWCHAEGTNTYVAGNGSHAEGQSTIVDGFGSHAEGLNTKASGDYIHVEGYNTIASSNYQHVQGKYNVEDTEEKYAHIVGNGTKNTPSNAHTLDWDGNTWFAGDVYVGSTSGINMDEGSKKLATEDFVKTSFVKLNSNTVLSFYCIEDVTIVTNGISKVYPANSNVEVRFTENDVFEIIPTSNNSIFALNAFPGALNTFYPWLEGVKQFSNILFDMNSEDMYTKWSQGNQGVYKVQFAQYMNCIFWSDNPYINEVTKRTNYALYNTSQIPLCYSNIPENTFKSFYLALGVVSDPNWANPLYRESFANASWATQAFSYYGARTIGLPGLDSSEFNIVLPKDCRGLMFDAGMVENAGVFDAINVTDFGAKSGSWRDAFGKCTALRKLYIKNLKVNLDLSWSPIEYNSISYIISKAANTNKITISVSPYTYYLLNQADFELAAEKNITIELLSTHYSEDKRLNDIANKADKEYVDEAISSAKDDLLNGACIIKSSTEGSTKRFKITVDDTGALSATEIIETT